MDHQWGDWPSKSRPMSLLDVGCVSQLIHAICILNTASSNQQWHWKSSIHIPFINDCPIESFWKKRTWDLTPPFVIFPFFPFDLAVITGSRDFPPPIPSSFAARRSLGASRRPRVGPEGTGARLRHPRGLLHSRGAEETWENPNGNPPKTGAEKIRILWIFTGLWGKNSSRCFGVTILIYTWLLYCDIYLLPYTQSGKSVQRLFESNKSQWDAAHSGSHRSQCNIVQISMGRCVPAIIYFV